MRGRPLIEFLPDELVMVSTAKQHGGRREGAGRKPAGPEPRRPVTVWLTEADRDRLREIGNGNASEGVRRLLADHFAPPDAS